MKPLGLVHTTCQRTTDPRRTEATADQTLEHSPGWDLAVTTCPACGSTFTTLVPRRTEVIQQAADVEVAEPVEQPRDLDDADELPTSAVRVLTAARKVGAPATVRGTPTWVGVRVETADGSWVALWTAGKRTGTWRLDGIHRYAEPAKAMTAALKAAS